MRAVVLAAARECRFCVLTEYRGGLEGMDWLPDPGFAALDSISQTEMSSSICGRLGRPFPRIWVLPMVGESEVCSGARVALIANTCALAGLGFPLIVKPLNSVTRSNVPRCR